MNKIRCSFCETLPDTLVSSKTKKSVFEKIENHLTLFSSEDDPFHAVFYKYFCEECYSIYEVGHHFSLSEEKEVTSYSLECLTQSQYEHVIHESYDRLLSWLILQQKVKQLNQEFENKQKENVLVFHPVGQLLSDDLKKIREIGYDKNKEKYRYHSGVYTSFSDFIERARLGFQYFEHLTLLVFEVPYESLNASSIPYELDYYIYSDRVVPFSEMRRYDFEKGEIVDIDDSYIPILSRKIYDDWLSQQKQTHTHVETLLNEQKDFMLKGILGKEN